MVKGEWYAPFAMSDNVGCFACLKPLFSRKRAQKKEVTDKVLEGDRAGSHTSQTEQKKHNERLEEIVEAPPAYQAKRDGASNGPPTSYRPEVLETIKDAVDKIDSDLRSLSLAIHGELSSVHRCCTLSLSFRCADNPEVGFHEK